MLPQTSRPIALALLLVLLGAPLSGCFSDPSPAGDDGAPADHISRTWTLVLDEEAMDALDSASDPFGELESLIEAALVVRAGEAGDYVLVYTAPDGQEAAVPLSDMVPGVARTVPGVDPFAGATLKRGDDIIAARAPLGASGTRVGQLPLGAHLAPGSELSYTHALDVTSALRLEDVRTNSDIDLNALAVDVHLPLRGTLSLTSAADGASETRFDLATHASVAKPSAVGSLVLVEADALSGGEPLAFGFEVPNVDALLEMSMSAWLDGDRLSGVRSGEGAMRFHPELYAWATGADAERFGASCAGAAREERCTPDETPEWERTWDAGAREDIAADALSPTSPGEHQALRFMERLFAHDIAVGDAFTLIVEYDSDDDARLIHRDAPTTVYEERPPSPAPYETHNRTNDTTTGTTSPTQPTSAPPRPAYPVATPPMYQPPPPDPSRIRYTFTFETSVVEKTSIDVGAGTFDALQIAQTARLAVDAPELHEPTWDYENHTQHWNAVARGLQLEETVARHTIWLDAQRYLPLRVESEMPVEPGAILGRIADSLTTEGWAETGFEEFPRDSLAWTLTARATLEASRVTGDLSVSPAVGLTLATLMGGGAGLGNQGMGALMLGLPWRQHHYYEETVAVPPPAHPMPTPTPDGHAGHMVMEVGVTERADDGIARFDVRSTSNVTWDEMLVRLDREAVPAVVAACDDRPTGPGYFVCRDGVLLDPGAPVWTGDVLTVSGFHENVTFELIHVPTSTVVYGMSYASATSN